MEESGPSMRPTHHLGEMSIKVPAPFAGLSDLGFTAQYRAQQFNEPLRDVMLSDEVVILAFRDRSVEGKTLSDGARIADYVLNLVQPVVFTFLHDCAAIAHLRLSEVIEMRVSAENRSVAEFVLPLEDIVRPNGERLLWGLAS